MGARTGDDRHTRLPREADARRGGRLLVAAAVGKRGRSLARGRSGQRGVVALQRALREHLEKDRLLVVGAVEAPLRYLFVAHGVEHLRRCASEGCGRRCYPWRKCVNTAGGAAAQPAGALASGTHEPGTHGRGCNSVHIQNHVARGRAKFAPAHAIEDTDCTVT